MTKKITIIDAHEDIAFHLDYFKRSFVEPEVPCMLTLPGLKEANVKLVFNTIFVHPKEKPHNTLTSAMIQFDTYEKLYEDYNSEIYKVTSTDDISDIENNPRIGFVTLMEGADPIENLKDLDMFFEKGVRIIGPSWNNKNQYASGPDTKDGLTEQGRGLIGEMNNLGITLDLSHLNEKCFWDSIELTELIPIATHSNARALTDHPRNLKDEQLKAIADRGGVVGIVLYNPFLKTSDNPPTLEDVYAHADYMIELLGEDHVGIGSDMDGAKIEDFPEGLKSAADLKNIPDYLLSKGYSEDLVRKISSLNFLRVLKENLS